MQTMDSPVMFTPDGSMESREVRDALKGAGIPFIELDEDRYDTPSIEYAGTSFVTRDGMFSFIHDMAQERGDDED